MIYCGLVFFHIKMNYYRFNRKKLLKKAKDWYHNCGCKEKTAKNNIENKEFAKENTTKNNYRNL